LPPPRSIPPQRAAAPTIEEVENGILQICLINKDTIDSFGWASLERLARKKAPFIESITTELKRIFDLGLPSMDLILPLILTGGLDRAFFEGLDPTPGGVQEQFFQQMKETTFVESIDIDVLATLMWFGFVSSSDLDNLPLVTKGSILDQLTEYHRSGKYRDLILQLSQRTFAQCITYEGDLITQSEEYNRYQAFKRLFFFDHESRKGTAQSLLKNINEVFETRHYESQTVDLIDLPARPDNQNYFRQFIDKLLHSGLNHQEITSILEQDENGYSLLLLKVYNDFFQGKTESQKQDFIVDLQDYNLPYIESTPFSSYADYTLYWDLLTEDMKDFWFAAQISLEQLVEDAVSNIILPIIQNMLVDNSISDVEADKLAYWTQRIPTDLILDDIAALINDNQYPAEILVKLFAHVDFLDKDFMNNYIRDPNTIYDINAEIERQVINDEMNFDALIKLIKSRIFDYSPIVRYNLEPSIEHPNGRKHELLYIKDEVTFKGALLQAVGQADLDDDHLPGNVNCFQASNIQALHILLKTNYLLGREIALGFYVENAAFFANELLINEVDFINLLINEPNQVMQIYNTHYDTQFKYRQNTFYNLLQGDGYMNNIEHELTPEEVIQEIRNRVELQNEIMIAHLYGLRSGFYQSNTDTHFFIILEYKDGWFKLSDSDATHINEDGLEAQGQFLWVREEVVGAAFREGNTYH